MLSPPLPNPLSIPTSQSQELSASVAHQSPSPSLTLSLILTLTLTLTLTRNSNPNPQYILVFSPAIAAAPALYLISYPLQSQDGAAPGAPKVVVFAHHKAVVHALAAAFERARLPHVRIDGDCDARDRWVGGEEWGVRV
jgi:hypothetical protein